MTHPQLPSAAAGAFRSTNPPGAADIDHARGLMREIGSLAGTALELFADRTEQQEGGVAATPADEDIDHLRTRIRVLRLFLDRIGWVADVGLRTLGEDGSLASAEDWMLPRV